MESYSTVCYPNTSKESKTKCRRTLHTHELAVVYGCINIVRLHVVGSVWVYKGAVYIVVQNSPDGH